MTIMLEPPTANTTHPTSSDSHNYIFSQIFLIKSDSIIILILALVGWIISTRINF